MTATLLKGDCLEIMKTIEAESLDSCVTDPPYHLTSIVKRFGKTSQDDDNDTGRRAAAGADGLARLSKGFMGRSWDGGDIAFRKETWQEVYRLLKPGAFLCAFSHERNYHRMAVAIEDAGFDVRGMLLWAYGQGMPKSLNVGKAISAMQTRGGSSPQDLRKLRMGDDYEPTGQEDYAAGRAFGQIEDDDRETTLTPDGEKWKGFGTAMKPCFEPVCLARKPLSEKTVAANVLKHGTGGLNIDGCRIEYEETQNAATNPLYRKSAGYANGNASDEGSSSFQIKDGSGERNPNQGGRWPGNLIHDGSEAVMALFPTTESGTGAVKKDTAEGHQGSVYGKESRPAGTPNVEYGDAGSAARLFYQAKASDMDRLFSKHPTVKPIDLIRWLVTLVTPPGGKTFDPFAGSGTIASACAFSGHDCVMIEREPEYQADIERRLALIANPHEVPKPKPKRVSDAGPLFGGDS